MTFSLLQCVRLDPQRLGESYKRKALTPNELAHHLRLRGLVTAQGYVDCPVRQRRERYECVWNDGSVQCFDGESLLPARL